MQRILGFLTGRLARRLLLALALSLGSTPLPQEFAGVGFALADDDDDDDDDDDNRAGSSGGGGGRVTSGRYANPFRPFIRNIFRPARPRAAARKAAPPPAFVQDELVAAGLDDTTIAGLTTNGFAVIERQPVGALGTNVVRLRIPNGTTMQVALQQVRDAAPSASADFNHYYRPEQAAERAVAAQPETGCDGPHCPAVVLVGWPTGGDAACGGSATIGLIDTAINPDHAALTGSDIEVIRIGDGALPESGRQHGTAVATLLVGAADSTTPGLLPAAKLIAVDVFHRGARQDDRADAYSLARGIDLLIGKNVDAINMSLSGPPNAVVEQLVGIAATKQVLLVAAAGNEGPRAQPVYPAGYPGVIAVTAVDQRKRPYRRAGQGEHIDLAAPGVNIWTAASIKGARPKTGTSFAAPFVTAAAALARASGTIDIAAIQDRLMDSAEDLGQPGKDPVFGWGLLNASTLCRPLTP